MEKFQFALDIFMGLVAITILGYIKVSEYQLGKTYKQIKQNKKAVSIILYLVAICLIFASTYKIADMIGDKSYDMQSIVGSLSRIFIGILGLQFFSEKVKIMDKGIVYKYHVLKKEDLVVFKLIGDFIEIKYREHNVSSTLKIKSEKEDSKELVKDLKRHFSLW